MKQSDLPDNSIAKRIRDIRTAMNLTKKDFANLLGISNALVCKIEQGDRVLTDRIKTIVCLRCNVNEDYLVNGTGEMFSNTTPDDIINQLAAYYNLSDCERIFLSSYFELPEEKRLAIVSLLTTFVDNSTK